MPLLTDGRLTSVKGQFEHEKSNFSYSLRAYARQLLCFLPTPLRAAAPLSGADLDADEVASVYKEFGISGRCQGSLRLQTQKSANTSKGLVDESLIGTKSISCVYIEALSEGKGLDVTVKNITWCTPDMYMNAMVTAGITDANVRIVAPFNVSGTAALTGIYKAYEDITGKKLDDNAKLVGTQELPLRQSLPTRLAARTPPPS